MKAIWKAIITLSVVTAVAASVGSYAYLSHALANTEPEVSGGEDYMEASNGTYTLKLDRSTLHFTVSSASHTWDSGSIDPSDESITSLREAFLVSPATIYSLSPTGGETSFSMFDSGHAPSTTVRLSSEPNGIRARISVIDGKRAAPSLSMTFNIHYLLEQDGLTLRIDGIEENPESTNKLSRIALYPGFGSSYKLNPGYMLIPDGSGAIIDLSKKTDAQSALQLSTYGKDFAVNSSKRSYYAAEQLSLPMFGIAGEESSLMAVVESGQEYSELNAKVMGMADDYNCAYFRFLFRDVVYQYQGMDQFKTVPQEVMNSFEPCVHYKLYDSALSYGEYASEYRSYLQGKNLLPKSSSSAKLRLDFLMADSKKALFGEDLVKMTSADDVRNIVNELYSTGNRYEVSLRGYTAGGLSHSYPYSLPVDGAIGGNNGVRALVSDLHDKGISTNLQVDMLRSLEGKGASGNDLALNVSQKQVTTNDYVNGTSNEFQRLVPSKTVSLMKEYERRAGELGVDGFDFQSLGFDLYSTFFHEVNTRSQSKKAYIDAASAFELRRHMRKPNLYMLPYCEGYLDAPIGCSSFLIETESIPFLSMLLSGKVNLYSSPVNLNYLGQKQLLQMIDYGVCPSYLLTKEETMLLIDSPTSSFVHTSEYSLWKDDMTAAYSFVIDTLKQVDGATFSSREQISKDVYRNCYSNGKDIIVNYGSTPYEIGGKEVPSLGSAVIDHE